MLQSPVSSWYNLLFIVVVVVVVIVDVVIFESLWCYCLLFQVWSCWCVHEWVILLERLCSNSLERVTWFKIDIRSYKEEQLWQSQYIKINWSSCAVVKRPINQYLTRSGSRISTALYWQKRQLQKIKAVLSNNGSCWVRLLFLALDFCPGAAQEDS